MHLAVARIEGLEHVHYLRTERSHTGTTTYPNHLALAVEDRVEITIRTRHRYLITRLEREDIR